MMKFFAASCIANLATATVFSQYQKESGGAKATGIDGFWTYSNYFEAESTDGLYK